MELTVIITGLLATVGGLAVLTGLLLHVAAAGRARGVTGRPGAPGGRSAGPGLARRVRAWLLVSSGRVLALWFVAVLAIVTVAAGLSVLVEDVTHGDGVAVVDHPIARFVAAHRTPALTSVMGVVSTVGGPGGMAIFALAAGLLVAAAWRSWAPAVELGITVAGIVGLTMVVKAVLGLSRPPLVQAVSTAEGYGFPSGHAATAAAVCGVAAWLCTARIRSWPVRVATWAAAATLTAAVGISRVYLGVHWTTDVLGGWAFGTLWMAAVMSVSAIVSPVRSR